ncbi:hypothetical protein GGR57DRAFT_75334 [Xylariaceae sp. FL1272]|nr:hypothetical protein GGR57DRAFT_75334 [Xylariaceae sp. FL1272]
MEPSSSRRASSRKYKGFTLETLPHITRVRRLPHVILHILRISGNVGSGERPRPPSLETRPVERCKPGIYILVRAWSRPGPEDRFIYRIRICMPSIKQWSRSETGICPSRLMKGNNNQLRLRRQISKMAMTSITPNEQLVNLEQPMAHLNTLMASNTNRGEIAIRTLACQQDTPSPDEIQGEKISRADASNLAEILVPRPGSGPGSVVGRIETRDLAVELR